MSRIGKLPIPLPPSVTVTIADDGVTVVGPKGQLSQHIVTGVTVRQEGTIVYVERASDSREHRALHGLSRTLVNNMVLGVTSGFSKTLELNGVGYRATLAGNKLTLALGFSHPVEINPPDGIKFTVEGTTKVIVSGIDKQQVGEIAAQIRRLRKPEPYLGKGIKYANEIIRRKAGKAGKVGGKKK